VQYQYRTGVQNVKYGTLPYLFLGGGVKYTVRTKFLSLTVPKNFDIGTVGTVSVLISKYCQDLNFTVPYYRGS